ncbi:uncharacterized protein LOC109596889 isoform X2 [Aethina tumida]|uniref:uncharacterized protein LOC109596889 isoform X2 n=1 Tax=Aethina tumida TaxID=116153 RepID=UPI0021481342|nr:uncharacterized protein LOC109596889 isoform X2 [Aethina tumida]
MPILHVNNAHNVVRSKMSEDFTDNAIVRNSNCLKYLDENHDSQTDDEDLNTTYDHMYASNSENDDVGPDAENCQNTESEVKFLKQWLILHLDLIQQQNDEILDKENQIHILRKENEMLKERINCMEKGTPFRPEKHSQRSIKAEEEEEDEEAAYRHLTPAAYAEDMTQDSSPYEEEDNKDNIELLDLDNCLSGGGGGGVVGVVCAPAAGDNGGATAALLDDVQKEAAPVDEAGDSVRPLDGDYERKRDSFNFTFENCDFDPMKSLRMSIRRKRVYSNSSAFSNNDSLNDDKSFRRMKKKRRRVPKDTGIVTTSQPYVTQVGETNGVQSELDATSESSCNLEVPRWRIKHYVSCYTMEGTENLDDEVYNKRHSRLEIDERRRKRWDVQRIREQRVIEKLKLRQERVGSGAKTEDQQDALTSLWPFGEDVKCIEVFDELPVCAFGAPIPKLHPREFSLPWLTNPTLANKQTSSKKSTARRKGSRR